MKSLVRRVLRLRVLVAVTLVSVSVGAASAVAALFVDAVVLWVLAVISTAVTALTLQVSVLLVLRQLVAVRQGAGERLKKVDKQVIRQVGRLEGRVERLAGQISATSEALGHLAGAMHSQVEEMNRTRLERVVSERRLEGRLVQSWEEWAYEELGPRVGAGPLDAGLKDGDSSDDA